MRRLFRALDMKVTPAFGIRTNSGTYGKWYMHINVLGCRIINVARLRLAISVLLLLLGSRNFMSLTSVFERIFRQGFVPIR